VINHVHDVVLDIMDKTLTLRQWRTTTTQPYTKDSHVKDVMLHVIPGVHNNGLYSVVQPTSFENCYVNAPTFDVDASNNITIWNIHIAEFSGFTADYVIGLSVFDFLDLDTLPPVQHMLSCSREDAGPSTCRICFYTLAAIPKMVQLSAVASRDADQNFYCCGAHGGRRGKLHISMTCRGFFHKFCG